MCCAVLSCLVVSNSLLTPWIIACQAPLFMDFSRQEYWNGLPFPSPGDLPNPGIEARSPALQADSLLSEPPGKPNWYILHIITKEKNSCHNQNMYINENYHWIRKWCSHLKASTTSDWLVTEGTASFSDRSSGVSPATSHLSILTTLWGRHCYYLYITEGKTVAWKGEVMCPGSLRTERCWVVGARVWAQTLTADCSSFCDPNSLCAFGL